MDVPKFLYKYRGGSSLDLSTLAAGKLWFSRPSNFNDPFDCALDVAASHLDEDGGRAAIEELMARGALKPSDLKSLSAAEIKRQINHALLDAIEQWQSVIKGVCCFSEMPDDLLMWGHYGNCHQGFCLEYETDKDALFKKAHQVQYSDSFPHVDINRIAKSDLAPVLDLVLTKATCWKYEKEWRVLHNEGNHLHSVERASLSKVYFGAKMPESQQSMIAALLDNTDTKLARMHLDKSGFALTSEEVEFERIDYRKKVIAEKSERPGRESFLGANKADGSRPC